MSTPYFQMHKQQAPPASKLGASSHNTITGSTNGRSVTTSTAKVLNKINALVRPPEHFLKPRPPPKGAETTGVAAERFQIVHTPDRASGTTPLWEIPKTEAEYRAAILNMKTHGQLRVEGGPARRTDVEVRDVSGAYDRLPPRPGYVDDSTDAQPTPRSRRTKGARGDGYRNTARAMANPCTDRGSPAPRTGQYPEQMAPKTMPRVYYPSSPDLLGDQGRLATTPPPASAPLSARIPLRAGGRRVASAEVLRPPRPPRPLSERAMIPLGPRARRGEQTATRITVSSSASTLVGSPAVTPIHGVAQGGARDGRTAVGPDNKARRRSIRGQGSADLTVGDKREMAAGDGGNGRPGMPSARRMRSPQEPNDTHDTGSAVSAITHCHVCQEPCKPEAGLCGECRDRYQPLEEVLEYSESEYGDEQVYSSPHPAPGRSPVPHASPPAPGGRGGGAASPDAGAEDATTFRGWSQQQQQQRPPRPPRGHLASFSFSSSSSCPPSGSRSASASPTPHLALQLKVVPHQSIRKVSVTSPARGGGPEHRRSALYHVQQAMRPRGPVAAPVVAPGQGRGDVDGPDERAGEAAMHRSSRGGHDGWSRYHGVDEDTGEEGGGHVYDPDRLVSPVTNSESVRNRRNSGASARSSTYDRIYSIYDAYWSQKEDEVDDGMF